MMTPVTSLLDAIYQHNVAALEDCIEHDEVTAKHLTHEEAVALWDAGWESWSASDQVEITCCHTVAECYEPRQEGGQPESEIWAPSASAHSLPLWHLTLGVFLHQLHAAFPALPGVPTWVNLWDVEEE